MYELKTKINNVSLLNISKHYVTYKKDKKLFICHNEINIDPLLWKIDEKDKKIWLKDSLWNNYELDLETLESKQLDINLAVNCIEDFIVGFSENGLGIFDKNNKKNIVYLKTELQSFKGCIFYENKIGLRTNLSIYFYDIKTGNPLWHFDLNQFGTYRKVTDDLAYKVVQFVGIWQGKLLVQLTNARLIALDINTGELLHDIEINKTNPLTKAYYDAYIKMHLVDDKIIWLTNQTLLHIDLNTFTPVVVKEYYNLPKERQWRFMHNTYHKGKLYFTADYAWQYVTPSYVGVMDAQTGTVLWSQQLEKTGGLPEAPKVTDEKLYIRTNNKVLHIFEKTENESV